MKHATEGALREISALLSELRLIPSLTERKPGIFYRNSKAFLHFHEDPAGMFADLKQGSGWVRIKVSGPKEGARLIAMARKIMNSR